MYLWVCWCCEFWDCLCRFFPWFPIEPRPQKAYVLPSQRWFEAADMFPATTWRSRPGNLLASASIFSVGRWTAGDAWGDWCKEFSLHLLNSECGITSLKAVESRLNQSAFTLQSLHIILSYVSNQPSAFWSIEESQTLRKALRMCVCWHFGVCRRCYLWRTHPWRQVQEPFTIQRTSYRRTSCM